MKEYFVDIPTADGRMESFVTHPEQNGPFPAIIVCMDIFGLREELFDVARRLSTVGYYVVVPDFYYRLGRIRLNFPENAIWSPAMLGPEQEGRARAAGRAMHDAQAMEDIGSILHFFQNAPVRADGKGILGFCMGGRLALAAAGRFPEHFRVTAGLHPSSLVNDTPHSPHLLAHRLRGEIYCGFPEDDPLAPRSTIETLAKVLPSAQLQYRFTHHRGAVHGYALPYRSLYRKQATNRDWELIFAMLHRQIPAYRVTVSDGAARE
jgi:carboxymethylenebutenolidase